MRVSIQFQTTPYREKKREDNALETKWCRLRHEIRDSCEPPESFTVHKTEQSDCGSYESLLFLHGTVLDTK